MNPALGVGRLCLLCEATVKLQGALAKPGRPPDKFCHQLGILLLQLGQKVLMKPI